jgi:hypothetical protein
MGLWTIMEHMFEDVEASEPPRGSGVAHVGYTGDLTVVDPAGLADEQLRDALSEFEQVTGWAQAGQLAVIAELARRDDLAAATGPRLLCSWEDPHRYLVDEVATLLVISRMGASHRLQLAQNLTGLPTTLTALRDGCLDLSKAREIADQLQPMESAELIPVLEAAAIEYGRTHTRTQLKAWLRKRVLAAEPVVAEIRRQNAETNRRVVHYPGEDGMGVIMAELPAHQALAIWRTIDQVAHTSRFSADHPDSDDNGGADGQSAAERRSMDQRRADAFVDLMLDRVPSTTPRTEVLVTVSAETLAGLSDEPGELAGSGPITAQHARELADDDAVWRRMLTDPATGTVLEVSQHTYRPSRELARTITARDVTCRFPGCRRAATGCDIDHTTPWPHGATEASNLAVLCRSHHLLKHHTNWRVEHLPGAIMKWTTPGGRVFHTYPADHRPLRLTSGTSSGDPPAQAA